MKISYSKIALIIISILAFAFAANAQTGKNSDKSAKHLKDRPLKIKSKIMPNENVLSECNIRTPIQIFIAVLVTFDSSGKVTAAVFMGSNSGCRAFDEEVLRVAKKIKFNPEIKNGVAVTIVKPITYQLNVGVTRNSF